MDTLKRIIELMVTYSITNIIMSIVVARLKKTMCNYMFFSLTNSSSLPVHACFILKSARHSMKTVNNSNTKVLQSEKTYKN